MACTRRHRENLKPLHCLVQQFLSISPHILSMADIALNLAAPIAQDAVPSTDAWFVSNLTRSAEGIVQ